VSFEDFKANIRNGIITQEVMRDQVGRKVQFTQGEVQRYFEQHKQEYAQPESVHLSEILVSTGAPAPAPAIPGAELPDDPARLAAAKVKADDIEARLHAGGDFAQLAKNFSDGPTAAEGGDLGQFRRGSLAKVLEDQTFALQSGQFTEPIHTRQGFVILKVAQHVPGGVPAFKDVEQDVEEAFYTSRMEPAMRDYLTTMREQAYIDIKPGYTDAGASPKQIKPVYSAYTPPSPKKKKKVERTRFRESTHTFRQKSAQASAEPAAEPGNKNAKAATPASMKPGKKEKIRFGQAPTKTLPNAPQTKTEDAGAVQQASNNAQEPVNPLETNTTPQKKTRLTDRAKQPKQPKAKGPKLDKQAPAAPDATEVADRQTQAAPLGLAGDTAARKKKKKSTTTGDKTRLTDKNKKPEAPAQKPAAPAPDLNAAPSAPAPQTPPPAPQQ
jgi:peptidyl-prolyl cis-trans isomerase SurA